MFKFQKIQYTIHYIYCTIQYTWDRYKYTLNKGQIQGHFEQRTGTSSL